MSNKYSKAFKSLIEKRELCANNVKKAQSLALKCADKRVYDMLIASNIDARYFNARDLYCAFDIVNIAHNVTRDHISASDVKQNSLCAIKTLLNARAHDAFVTRHDIECAMLNSCKVSDERAHIVHERQSKHSTARQVQLAISMMKNANMMREISKHTYEARDSALLDACAEKFADFVAC